MNLEQAREQVITMLDDPDGQRWQLPPAVAPPGIAFDPSNEIDLAIQSAAVECMSLYVYSGGDFFDVVQEVTTAGGTFSFTSQTAPNIPLLIKAVSLKSGNNNFRLHGTREQDIEVDIDVAQNLKVRVVYVPDFTSLAETDELTYSLSSFGSTLSWPMFDQWVLSVAAKHLTPKENEANAQLDDRVAMLQNACSKAPEQPISVTFPDSRGNNWSINAALYRWSYVARDAVAGKTCCLRLHRISLR
jgi:hypothetical protein